MTGNFAFACEIIKRFPGVYNELKVREVFKAHGASGSDITQFVEFHKLVEEYLAAKAGGVSLLGRLELRILNPNDECQDIDLYSTLNNEFGYTALHLALMAGKYEAALEMVKAGSDIYAMSKSGIMPLHLITKLMGHRDNANGALGKLAQIIMDKVDEIDIILDRGESLTDSMITSEPLKEIAIQKTKDSLFSFYKEGADMFLPSKNTDKTYIAISDGDGLWSTGIWSFARLCKQHNSDVEFYLITKKMVEKGGDEFLRQFDVFINPGAADTYPGLPCFNKDDCRFDMDLEKLYQLIAAKLEELQVPYFGICAGAQHLALYHNGSLIPIKGYKQGHHQVKFIPGTWAHFLTLTKEQQKDALEHRIFPKVEIQGDTAHHFAANSDDLGILQLGAVSEDDVAMAYSDTSGIRYATQFHPEHYYGKAGHEHETSLWDNFIEIAIAHHKNPEYFLDEFEPIGKILGEVFEH